MPGVKLGKYCQSLVSSYDKTLNKVHARSECFKVSNVGTKAGFVLNGVETGVAQMVWDCSGGRRERPMRDGKEFKLMGIARFIWIVVLILLFFYSPIGLFCACCGAAFHRTLLSFLSIL